MIDERFAGLLRAWRKRFKVTRVGAAYALRAAAGWKTNDSKILTRETAKALPQRPLAALELIHGLLAVYPPKPLISPRDFAKRLRDWRRAYRLTQMQACMALGLSLLVLFGSKTPKYRYRLPKLRIH